MSNFPNFITSIQWYSIPPGVEVSFWCPWKETPYVQCQICQLSAWFCIKFPWKLTYLYMLYRTNLNISLIMETCYLLCWMNKISLIARCKCWQLYYVCMYTYVHNVSLFDFVNWLKVLLTMIQLYHKPKVDLSIPVGR